VTARSGIPHTWLYFIQAGENGPIKIGVSEKPFVRLESLQTAHFEQLRLIGFAWAKLADERALHEHFAAHRIRGEWFTPAAEILAFAEWNRRQWRDDLIRCFPESHDPHEALAQLLTDEWIIARAPSFEDGIAA